MVFFHIAICFAILSESTAQVSLSRQVIGTTGGQVNIGANLSWSYTSGEAVIGTRNYEGFSLTQGFHQPVPTSPLQFEIIIEAASCPGSTDGSASLINLSGCTPPYLITWSNGATGNGTDRLTAGLYNVTVTTPDCNLSASFTIEAGPQEACVLRFFNAISPNGDAVNDTWRIENIDLPEYAVNEVEIYNRWGQMVWSGNNYNNTHVVWDGRTSEGLELPDATYFYIAHMNDRSFKGYVEITR